jgi:hypothetical protein
MPRISLKRLLASIVLLAIGCGFLAFGTAYDSAKMIYLPDGVLLTIWLTAGGLIGSGFFCPFRLTLFGFAVGIICQILFSIYIFFAHLPH